MDGRRSQIQLADDATSQKAARLWFHVDDRSLRQADTDGKAEINWEESPQASPERIHREIDAHRFDWSRGPEWVITHEPLVGERIIYNPCSGQSSSGPSGDARHRRIQETWRSHFGRSPRIRDTVPLHESLTTLRNELRDASTFNSPADSAQLELLDRLIHALRPTVGRQAGAPAQSNADDDLRRVKHLLQQVVDSGRGKMVQEHLRATHPFELQGRFHDGPALLVIDDPELQGKDEWRRFATLQQERACLVALDLSRLSHESWRQLPAAMWCDQQGKTHVLWNYHHELADWQIREMSLRPYLIHQYAKHVANQWEAQTSRRPRIHVTSLVSKNFRYPSLMIDPRVDLARAPTRMFRHNEWIMQLETETERQVTPNRGGADAPPGEVAGYNSASDSGLRITARFPNGIKKQGIQGHPGRGNYTVTKWHPNGLIAFRAEYRDDQPHGQQSKWHPNGTVALQIEYRHGRRHGKATAWNEQGQKKQEGEFHDGQLVGSWTVWSADGVADKPSPEGPGARR